MKKILLLLSSFILTTGIGSSIIACQTNFNVVKIVEYQYWNHYRKHNKLPDGVPWNLVNYVEIDKSLINSIELYPSTSPSGAITYIKFINKDGSFIKSGSRREYWDGNYNDYKNILFAYDLPKTPIEIKEIQHWND